MRVGRLIEAVASRLPDCCRSLGLCLAGSDIFSLVEILYDVRVYNMVVCTREGLCVLVQNSVDVAIYFNSSKPILCPPSPLCSPTTLGGFVRFFRFLLTRLLVSIEGWTPHRSGCLQASRLLQIARTMPRWIRHILSCRNIVRCACI